MDDQEQCKSVVDCCGDAGSLNTLSGSIRSKDKMASDSDYSEETCGIQISCCSHRKRYGLRFLQHLATPRWTLLLVSMAYFFTEGTVSGVFNACITTVEKQFQLRTIESGLIGGCMDLGSFLSVVITSYFGDRIFKPLWMTYGILICCLGSVVFALSQFTSPAYSYGEEATNYCGNVSDISCGESSIRNYKYAFMFGTLLNGLGAQLVQTLGVSYLDENVEQRLSPLYNGIYFAIGGALGPATGYMLGGLALTVFNIPNKIVNITISSSLWVGAWWIVYVTGAIGLFLVAIPVMLLPRYLPNTEKLRENREQMSASIAGKQLHSGGIKQEIRGFVRLIWSLAKNGVYVSVALSNCMHAAFLYGFLNYSIKLGVHILGLPESNAAFYLGACSIGSAVSGYFMGGFFLTRFKLTLRGILLFMIASSTLAFAFCFGFLVDCPQTKFAGATSSYSNTSLPAGAEGIIAACNKHCGCDTDLYNPVCDELGVTYFSPCHAGCATQISENLYTDCSCVAYSNNTDVSRDYCADDICPNAPWIFAILIVSFFGTYMGAAANMQACMRSVAFDQRTSAISVQIILTIISGRIVGRLLLGEAIEQSCLVSSTECGSTGACRSYLREDMTRNVTLLFAFERGLCAMFAFAAWVFYKRKMKNVLSEEPESTDRA